MLMAGLDGIKRNTEPLEPMNRDLYELGEDEAAKVPQVPGSLSESLDALEKDHDFLLAGGVFTPDLIDTWIQFKRQNEVEELGKRPHPYEFYMYFDI
jgi:glutamine synthetase